MSLDSKPVYTGGCQCGAVRFRVEGAMKSVSICHCRMCQKAFGSFYAPLATPVGSVTWTRGEPKRFRSSNIALRGFCAECGTPLSFELPEGVGLSIGAFDDPAAVAPRVQWGIEAKIAYVDDLPALPAHRTEDDPDVAADLPHLRSFQHPDYDTDAWPPRPEKD